MRLGMERFAAITKLQGQLINFTGQIVKTFGTEKKTIGRMLKTSFQPDVIMQRGMRGKRGEIEVFTPTLGIEPKLHRDRLQQRGFSRTILTDKKRHGRM